MNSPSVPTGNQRFQSGIFNGLFRFLLGRLYFLAAIVSVESVVCFSGAGLLEAQKTLHLVAISMILVVFLGMLLGFGYSRLKAQHEVLPWNIPLFGIHLLCMGVIFSYALDPSHGEGWPIADDSGYARSVLYLIGTILVALACVPLPVWQRLIRAARPYWPYALFAGAAAWGMGFPIRSVWRFSQHTNQILQIATFQSVLPFLRFLLPDVTSDAATSTIATSRFAGTIGGRCAGMEGLGLVLVFCLVWLWHSRKELRFPQALLLIPCGLASIWILNVVRLCALFVIEEKVSSEIADIGFHSQFGWISFTAVALAISLATQKLSWVRKIPVYAGPMTGEPLTDLGALDGREKERGESVAIRAYLVPFLAILAATSISKAASGYFEWLYPLRFVAAAVALLYFWPKLKKLNWRFGWLGPVAGAAVFLLWIAPSWWSHQPSTSALGAELAALSPTARWSLDCLSRSCRCHHGSHRRRAGLSRLSGAQTDQPGV